MGQILYNLDKSLILLNKTTSNCIISVVLLKIFLYNCCIPTILEGSFFIQFLKNLYNRLLIKARLWQSIFSVQKKFLIKVKPVKTYKHYYG